MKRTFEQGRQAYFAGVKWREVKEEIIRDLEKNAAWVLGWFSAQSEVLDKKYSDYSAILTKYEKALDKWEQSVAELDGLKKENKQLKQRLREALHVQTVH